MKKRQAKDIFKILTIPLSLLYLLLYIHFTDGFDNLIKGFVNLNYGIFVLALIGQLVIFFTEWVQVAFLRRRYQRGVPFRYTVYSSLYATFWGAVTPPVLSIGAILAMNCMNKQGLKPGDHASISFVQGIGVNIANMILNVAAVIVGFSYLSANFNFIIWILYIVGFLSFALHTIMLLMIPRFDKALIKISSWVISFGALIRIVKNKDKTLEKTVVQIQTFKANMKALKYTKSDWVVNVLVSTVKLLLANSLGILTAKAVGVEPNCAYVILVVIGIVKSAIMPIFNFIPIPGGFGIGELLAHIFTRQIWGNSLHLLIFVGRLVSYYFPILISLPTLIMKAPRGEGNPFRKISDKAPIIEEKKAIEDISPSQENELLEDKSIEREEVAVIEKANVVEEITVTEEVPALDIKGEASEPEGILQQEEEGN